MGIPVVIAIAIIGFFLAKKMIQLNEKKKFLSSISNITIDSTDDSRGIGYSGQRKVVSDGKGNTFIAYRKKYQGYYEIFVAKVTSQNNKLDISGTNKPISAVGQQTEQRVPSIAVDSKDTLHAVWYGADIQGQNFNHQIKYSRSFDQGKTWSGWRNIAFVSGFTSDQQFWQEHPSLLVGHDNTLYVVWEGKDELNKQQQIKFIKSTNGGANWTYWKNVEETSGNTQSRPSMVEDKQGNLYLFMYSSLGQGGNVQGVQYAVSKDKGDTWSQWQTLSDPKFDARHISTAADGAGNIYVAWRQPVKDGGPTQIIYRSFISGQWSGAAQAAASSNYQFFPSIGTDNSGNAFVSWVETPDPSGFPQENPAGGDGFISFLKNGAFQKPQTVGGNGNVYYLNVPGRVGNINSASVVYLEGSPDNTFNIKAQSLGGL